MRKRVSGTRRRFFSSTRIKDACGRCLLQCNNRLQCRRCQIWQVFLATCRHCAVPNVRDANLSAATQPKQRCRSGSDRQNAIICNVSDHLAQADFPVNLRAGWQFGQAAGHGRDDGRDLGTQDRHERPRRGGDGRPTLKTIAFMTGLGVTTVSRALKDAPEIGEETRRRVQLVARQVGYRPNRAGVRLRTGKTNVISLVLNTEEQVVRLRLGHDLRHFGASGPDALSPDRHALFAQQRSDGAGALCRRDRLGRRHHHFADRAQRYARALYDRARLPLRHAWPDRYGDRASRSTISTTAPMRSMRCASWPRWAARRLALLAPPPKLTYHHHMRDGFLGRARRERADRGAVHRGRPSTIRSTRSARGPAN